MATTYPLSIDSFDTHTDSVDDVMAADVNNLNDAVVALQTQHRDLALLRVKNTSGSTVAANDVGYIDSAGEFKLTTTAYLDVEWAVVVSGAANNNDIIVARRGLVTVILNGNCAIGDYLYTSTTTKQAQPQAYVRAEVFAVAKTANISGAGGTCEALLLTGTRMVPLHASAPLYVAGSAHGGSDFVAPVNGAPVGTSVVYGGLGFGNEEWIDPAAGNLTQMRLYNAARFNWAKIASVNLGTNTITVTDAADVSTWQNADTIRGRSETNTGTISAGFYFADFELIDAATVPTLTRAMTVGMTVRDTAAAAIQYALHPWVTYNGSLQTALRTQVANVPTEQDGPIITLNQRRFTMGCEANGAGTLNAMSLRVRGVWVAVP
jgi:hypothetical protein